MPSVFKSNVGAVDQWLRFALGFVMLFMAGSGVIGARGYLGVLPLLSAATRYCPVYHLLGLSTCAPKR